MRNAELDTFVSQVKSIADKHGFDFDFTQAGKWYEFNFTGERQNFIISIEDMRDIYPNPHSSYDTLGFDIDEFVRQVNNRIRQAELSLDYESQEDVIKRHQGRKDIEECARDNGVFIRDISKELKSLARQYGATEVKDSKQLKNNNMRRINDNNEEYVRCPNSNLLFYGTKLDINGNNCAIFEILNYQKFLIRQTSLGYGSRDWYIGTRSAMDAETFLEKNPDITIEDLERGVVMFAKDANPSWAKRVHLYKVFDSKNSKDMKRVRDSYENPNAEKAVDMLEDELHDMGYDMYIKGGYKGGPYSVFTGFGSLTRLDRIESFIKEHKEFKVTEKNDERSTIEFVYIGDSKKIKDSGNDWDKLKAALKSEQWEKYQSHFSQEDSFNYGDLVIMEGFDGEYYKAIVCDKERGDSNESYVVIYIDKKGEKKHKFYVPAGYLEHLEDDFIDNSISTDELTESVKSVSDSKKIEDSENELYELVADILQRDVLEKDYRKHPFTLYRQLPNGGIELETYKDTLRRRGVDYIKQLIKDWTGIDVEVKVGDEHSILGGETKVTLEVYPKATADISDSCKVKDAEDVVPLDGLLMVAFKDGQEEDGLKAIQGHANESGELEGVKYETYNVDEQDGVAVVDMCAVTNDANAFVKVLLKEWGVIDAVADLDFKKSDEMQNAEEQVSDSKVSDMTKPVHLRGYAEKVRAKRRQQKEAYKENQEEEEEEKQEVSDSRMIKDSAVDIEDAVYNAIMEASPAVQDAIVEIVYDNYDLNEFESTEDLSNTIWNDIDYLVSQLPEDLQEDFADTYGF